MPVYITDTTTHYKEALKHLEKAIESILSQTYLNFEFIIVNDGSSIEVTEVLKKYEVGDNRITVIHQENRGLIYSLNIGIEKAQGEYIARMDADDISLPNRFALQLDFLKKNPSVILLGGAMDIINQSDEKVSEQIYPTSNDDLQKLLPKSNYFAHPSVMFHRDTFIKIGGYRNVCIHAEDYDLWLRLSEKGQISNLPETILRYRVHSNNTSWKKCPEQVIAVFIARKSAEMRRNNIQYNLPNEGVFDGRQWLREQGISDLECEVAIAHHYNHWALLMKQTGQYDIALEILGIGYNRSCSMKLPKNISAKLLRTRTLIFLSKKSYYSAFSSFCNMIITRYS